MLKRKNEQLKQELDDMRREKEYMQEDLNVTLEINEILADMLNDIEKEIWKNQCGSVTNFQNKIRKILDDGKSKLVLYNKSK